KLLLPASAASPSATPPKTIKPVIRKRDRPMVPSRKAAQSSSELLPHKIEKPTATKSDRTSTQLPSHPATALIELVAIDNRLDVLARSGKIDVLKKLLHWYISCIVSAAPSPGPTGAGVVFRQRERKRIGLMFPVFDRAMQIPSACLQIRFRIEKLLHLKAGDLIFTCPFIGRFFAHLHKAAFSMAAMFSRIEAALAPNDRFHQHGIKMMSNRDATNQSIILLEPRRTHPFVKCINRISRPHAEISKPCSQCQQHAEDQFEDESDHSVRATIADYDYEHEHEHELRAGRGKGQLCSRHC